MKTKTRAIISIVVTVLIAIWGIVGYSSGDYDMAFFGIRISPVIFAIMIVVFIVIDVFSIKKAIEDEKSLAQRSAASQQRMAASVPLATPCRVAITRTASLVGAAMAVRVTLNGVEVGLLKNNQTLEFPTSYSENELVVIYNADGTTNSISFTAQPGGFVHVTLKYTGALLAVDQNIGTPSPIGNPPPLS